MDQYLDGIQILFSERIHSIEVNDGSTMIYIKIRFPATYQFENWY